MPLLALGEFFIEYDRIHTQILNHGRELLYLALPIKYLTSGSLFE